VSEYLTHINRLQNEHQRICGAWDQGGEATKEHQSCLADIK